MGWKATVECHRIYPRPASSPSTVTSAGISDDNVAVCGGAALDIGSAGQTNKYARASTVEARAQGPATGHERPMSQLLENQDLM